MVALKIKTVVEVASALRVIFKERKPEKLWVDKVIEFYNREVQKRITLYSTENEEKSSVTERWNMTMKDKIFKYFSANSSRKDIDFLDELVEKYNKTKHSFLYRCDSEGSKLKEINEIEVWRNL